MANKVIISVVSLLLVVGCLLGVVLLIVKSGNDDKDISTSTKAADSVCKPTEYKEACNKAVSDVSKNSSATHEDYILAAIRATASELQKSLEKATAKKKDLGDDKKESRGDLETCEKMLGYAGEELEQVLQVVAETEAVSLAEQIDPILVWLTAVRAYQTTCVEEIRDEKLKKDMQDGLETSNELTFNAQKIVYNVLDILKDIGVDLGELKVPSNEHNEHNEHRRLLDEVEEMDLHGFPSWVPNTDRRLLGGKKKGGGGKKPKGQGLFKTPPPPPLPPNAPPNVVVAQDGSGKFKSIKQALASYPANHQGRFIIHVKAGTYSEGQIIVDKKQNNVFMYGDGRDKTIITGNLNFAIAKIGTSQTATVVALGERFMARGITFRNTIGPAGHQAVAFRSQSPHTVMMDCSFEGYQDTLYYHTHDQFYKNCAISGTVDFIFGTGRAYIQDSDIFVRKPDKNQANMVTADGRMKMEEAGGVVLHNCKINAAPELAPVKGQFASYLGRPWKPAATSVIMMCDVGDLIKPDGWTIWESPEGKNNHMTCMFREFGNRGPGANLGGRVKWKGFRVIGNQKEAQGFSAGAFLMGGTWLPQMGVPARLGL